MALRLVTAQEMREIDRMTIEERGVTGDDLMERAGRGVAEVVQDAFAPRAVGIVTGKGNNAGDGLVVARYLAKAGVEVRLLALSDTDRMSEAGRTNWARLPEGVKHLTREDLTSLGSALAGCDVVVDAVLGTGVEGAPRGLLGEAITAINDLDIPVVAIDVPSGLPESGRPEGACIRADRTVTMGCPKTGMLRGEGPMLCGEIEVLDIGFDSEVVGKVAQRLFVTTGEDVRRDVPARLWDGHKGTFGALVVLSGQVGMSGAAYLTCATALRSGCGMVYAVLPERIMADIAGSLPEAVKVPIEEEGGRYLGHSAWERISGSLERGDAVAVGPGMGTARETARLVDEVVCQDMPMVIDADALNCLGEKVICLMERTAPTVITPHPGEMSRLTGKSVESIQGDRILAARGLARETKSVVVLKGFLSVVASPNGDCYLNPTGSTALAKGGAGDVLAGLIGGFLAQGMSAEGAARSGAYLHGLAGERAGEAFGDRGATAGDVVKYLPEVMREVVGMGNRKRLIAEKVRHIV